MCDFAELKGLTNDKVQYVRSMIVLTDDEAVVFDMTMRRKSAQEIADKMIVSERTVFRIKKCLKNKMKSILLDN